MPESKRCTKCGEVLPVSEFAWNRKHNRYNSQCRTCAAIEQRRRNSTKEGRIKSLVGKAKNRNKAFDLTVAEAAEIWDRQKGRCALSGAPLDPAVGSLYTASLDRIDSSLGYTKDNIQWVCWAVNKMKQDLSQDQFIAWCKSISDHNRH